MGRLRKGTAMVAAAGGGAALAVAAVLVLGLPAGCASTAPEPSAAPTPLPVVVDVWWSRGLHGKLLHRALWISAGDPSDPDWQQFTLDVDEDVDGPLEPIARRCEEDEQARYERADDACAIVADICAAEFADRKVSPERLRRGHLVIADGGLRRAVILDDRAVSLGIIDLASGTRTPLPPEVTTGWGFAAWSRDGSRLAIAHHLHADGHTPGAKVFVLDAASGARLYQGPVGGFVSAIAWNPDGTRVAVLSRIHRTGDNGFLERFYANLGHGRPYSDVFVQLIDVASGVAIDQQLAHDLPEVEVSLVWDPCEAP